MYRPSDRITEDNGTLYAESLLRWDKDAQGKWTKDSVKTVKANSDFGNLVPELSTFDGEYFNVTLAYPLTQE